MCPKKYTILFYRYLSENDPDPEIRKNVATLFCRFKINQPEIVDAIMVMQNDSDKSVRMPAIGAIYHIKIRREDAITAFLKLIEDPDPEIRLLVYKVIDAAELPGVRRVLKKARKKETDPEGVRFLDNILFRNIRRRLRRHLYQ